MKSQSEMNLEALIELLGKSLKENRKDKTTIDKLKKGHFKLAWEHKKQREELCELKPSHFRLNSMTSEEKRLNNIIKGKEMSCNEFRSKMLDLSNELKQKTKEYKIYLYTSWAMAFVIGSLLALV